jgi:alpha-beta hydrolase superfamily lysophospholipase
MRKVFAVATGVVLLLGIGWLAWPRSEDRGRPAFFADRSYNFEAIRALNDVAVAGGDSGEIMQAITGVKSGDAEGWYAAWREAGDRTAALADRTKDKIDKGNALLRAHTYYRSAEFFLPPHDPKRPAIWQKNTEAFYRGLDTLGVGYERITLPYGEHQLRAVYYPGPAGAETRPLIVMVGGYDSTMEELYLSLAAAAHAHGYAVLTYEGPGQGSIIRDQGLVFQADWEKPNGAVLDAFLKSHPAPGKIVLVGESLGGYLAPRAAAFDQRIDGVVAYDVFYDGGAIATRKVPRFATWLNQHGYTGVLSYLSGLTADPGVTWAQENGEWVFGVATPFAVVDAFKAYTLEPVASKITADVLIFSGADDHFVPPDQVEAFRKSLVNARSVTSVGFDRASGGAEHCQLGAPSLWQGALFDWLGEKFPSPHPDAAQ